MKKVGRTGKMESQIPLDIKFSLVYDESIQDIDEEDCQEQQIEEEQST